MPDTESFSEGVDAVLHVIRPHGRARSNFPANLDHRQLRQEPDESLHQWFARLVVAFCSGEPKRCAVEDNIVPVLRQNAPQLMYLKMLLRKRKDELFDYCMDGLDRVLIEYPAAR